MFHFTWDVIQEEQREVHFHDRDYKGYKANDAIPSMARYVPKFKFLEENIW